MIKICARYYYLRPKIALVCSVWYIPYILTQRINPPKASHWWRAGNQISLTPILTQKINNQITAPELRVISETEENIGILSLADALKLAKEKGLDLIEVVPTAKPPIAKIISFDKYRYQESKKLKKQKSQSKGSSNKQVQISIREAKNDLIMKANRVNEFLGEGSHVEIALRLRGREKGNKDFARKKLAEFLTIITPNHQVISGVQQGVYGLNVMIAPKK